MHVFTAQPCLLVPAVSLAVQVKPLAMVTAINSRLSCCFASSSDSIKSFLLVLNPVLRHCVQYVSLLDGLQALSPSPIIILLDKGFSACDYHCRRLGLSIGNNTLSFSSALFGYRVSFPLSPFRSSSASRGFWLTLRLRPLFFNHQCPCQIRYRLLSFSTCLSGSILPSFSLPVFQAGSIVLVFA